jgi:hypothetical protein
MLDGTRKHTYTLGGTRKHTYKLGGTMKHTYARQKWKHIHVRRKWQSQLAEMGETQIRSVEFEFAVRGIMPDHYLTLHK